jgi:site-specific DNA-methyltransferase (adenine-specific)
MSREQLIQRLKDLSHLTTAVYEDKPVRSEIHPTMKPLGLFKKQIRNSSREGEVVLDLFGGSGTTLIACQELNRKCRMMEYDPIYASAIIQRWEEATGQKAKRISA